MNAGRVFAWGRPRSNLALQPLPQPVTLPVLMSARWIFFLRGVLLLFALFASVQHLNAQDPILRNVTLRWEPSPSADVGGYRVYFGAESGTYTNTTDTGASTSLVIPNLECGVTYYFVVSAYEPGGVESDFSNEVAYTPTAPPAAVAGASLQLQATPDGQMTVSLRGPAGRTYDLQASPDLNGWTVIGLVTVGAAGTLDFVDPDAWKYPQRFYRARETQPSVQLNLAAAGGVVLTVTGQNGRDYEVQATQDFTDWTVLGTVTVGAGGAIEFFDPEAANYPARFYRTREIQP